MLEDDFTYVLRKALMGHGISPSDAAARAALPETDVLSFLRGSFSAETARKLAGALGLNPEAFARHEIYQPKPCSLPGIERLDLPFDAERVNAWLVRVGEIIVLFDAGFDSDLAINAVLSKCGRMPDRVFITHGHRDHIGALPALLAAGLPVHAAEIAGTISMKPGDCVCCGTLMVKSCDLSGHYTPALGFHIEGLERPVLVTGDALFAGSIGGCGTPEIYQRARLTLRTALAPLPDETMLLPGHGPVTTLGEERISNPFL
jgi:hydroxyacylglutathione hydrolase